MGARAAVIRLKRERSPVGEWMNGLEASSEECVLIVATAINWLVLSGLYCRVAKIIVRHLVPRPLKAGWKRRLRLVER